MQIILKLSLKKIKKSWIKFKMLKKTTYRKPKLRTKNLQKCREAHSWVFGKS
jgi:hypothetical protein